MSEGNRLIEEVKLLESAGAASVPVLVGTLGGGDGYFTDARYVQIGTWPGGLLAPPPAGDYYDVEFVVLPTGADPENDPEVDRIGKTYNGSGYGTSGPVEVAAGDLYLAAYGAVTPPDSLPAAYATPVPAGGTSSAVDCWILAGLQTVPATTATTLVGWALDSPSDFCAIVDDVVTLLAGLYVVTAHVSDADHVGGEAELTGGFDDDNLHLSLSSSVTGFGGVADTTATQIIRCSSDSTIGIRAFLPSESTGIRSNVRIVKLA